MFHVKHNNIEVLNIKITTKDDLEMFEGYVLMKKYNKNHHMDI